MTRRFLMNCVFALGNASLDAMAHTDPKWRYDSEEKVEALPYKWHVLTTDFSVAGGELTPSGAMKRDFIVQKYKKEIASMYDGPKL